MVLVNELEVARLSRKYSISQMDLFLMGLNLNGVNIKNKELRGERVRFSMIPSGFREPSFFALSISEDSNYLHQGGEITFGDKLIGKSGKLEEDTCDETYFRMGKKAITLNSNNRSSCSGCKFCGTYNLEVNDDEDLTNEKNILKKIDELKKEGNFQDLSTLDNIGIVTGCFGDEKKTLEHLLMVKDAFSKNGFRGDLKYVGSQIRSDWALKELSKNLPFSLYLTVECFENRKKMMKPSKSSLSLEKGRELLFKAKESGMDTTFLYILGLDPFDSIKKEFPKYVDSLTRHPIVNLMQNYVPSQEFFRNHEAKNLEYYAKSRKEIESIFSETGFRPRIWENYRSPWFSKYLDEKIEGPRI